MLTFFKKYSSLALFGFILVCIVSACEKDLFNPKKINTDGWDPTFAIPLTSSRLSIKDLIPSNATTDEYLLTDSTTGAISLSYKGEVFRIRASEVVNIPNQEQESSMSFDLDSIPGSGIPINVTTNTSDSIHYPLEVGDSIKIHEIGFLQGSMTFSVSTALDFQAVVTASITSLVKDGEPAQLVFNVDGDGTYKTYSDNINLADYTLDMTLGNLGYNEIIITYDYELTLPVPEEGLDAQTIVFDISQGFSNVTFGNIFGDLGNQIFNLDKDSLVLSIFENTLAGSEFDAFSITEPTINILVTSSIGVPLALNVVELNAFEPETNTTTQIQLQSNSFNVQAPTVIGNSKTSKIPITGNNSNINEVLTPTNKVITYAFAAELNPNGQNNTNFITPDAEISIQAEMELPLELGINGWVMQDTVDFSLESFSEITEATIRVILENGFPFSVDLQVYLLDSNKVVLDSLISTETTLLAGAAVDVNGDVIASTISSSDIGLSATTVANLGATKQLVIRGGLSTSNNGQIVKIYDHYELGVKMGMKVGVNGDNLLGK